MMSLLLILALLILITIPGIDVFTSVTVQTGGDVFLNISEADVPKDFHLLIWKFFTDDVLVSFWPSGKPNVRIAYAGRIDILERKYSIKLKNLQKSDVGLYMAMVTAKSEQIISKYNVTVQDPVFPVDLVIDSVSSASSLCNLTVTCTTKDSSISTTVRYAEGLSELSVCLVKKVVFSVGLIIMASAVIGVHLMQKSFIGLMKFATMLLTVLIVAVLLFFGIIFW
ncbi:PREDICTED: uncharacterized protein LOC107098181 [Cyprinodon variegatus]|uniref:uncharacterized protein LOC107098181 n=1 Tax=Cyprinodon variegatus TaxID=28743 RepID=UPI0007424DD6|nr:PREDICTED: uncharacterized protein LOC107098181 [Cyprinodon variegatus]